MIDISESTYAKPFCAVFGRTKYKRGEFQNMHRKFPLIVSGMNIPSSEALYQAMRFPQWPDIQTAILLEPTPFGAKKVAHDHIDDTRSDWHESVDDKMPFKVLAMYIAIQIKAIQHIDTFMPLFEEAKDKDIVEYSRHDAFWGAGPKDGMSDILFGYNVLGKLWDVVKQRALIDSYVSLDIPLPATELLIDGKPISIAN